MKQLATVSCLNIPLDISNRQTEPTGVFPSVEEDLEIQGKTKKRNIAAAPMTGLPPALLPSTRTFSPVPMRHKRERCHWTSSGMQSRLQVDDPTLSRLCLILFCPDLCTRKPGKRLNPTDGWNRSPVNRTLTGPSCLHLRPVASRFLCVWDEGGAFMQWGFDGFDYTFPGGIWI